MTKKIYLYSSEITHEIKSRLMSMHASVQLIKRKTEKGQIAETPLYIGHLASHLAVLTQQLSDLIDGGRIQHKMYKIQKEVVSLEEIVASLVKRKTQNKEIHVELRGIKGRDIMADRHALTRISLYCWDIIATDDIHTLLISAEEKNGEIEVCFASQTSSSASKANFDHEPPTDWQELEKYLVHTMLELHNGSIKEHHTKNNKKICFRLPL